MSKSMQKILVAMSVAIVLLVAPAPSWASQAHRPATEHNVGFMAQVWSWVESLLGGSQPQRRSTPSKTMTTPPPTTTPLPPPPEQGPLIDPNGNNG